jgi:glycosyltransferase involved in cell wall biosynthesis
VSGGRRTRVLFVHDDDPSRPLTPFMVEDLAILRARYEVEVLSLFPHRWAHLEALASPEVWRAVRRNDAVFAWFGSSAPVLLVAAALRRPATVVAGGSDVVYVPEIDYGLDPRDRARYALHLLGYRAARSILLFSEHSRQEFVRLPGMAALDARLSYLGVDTERFTPGPARGDHVLTVSYVSDKLLRRKGVYTLIEAARLTPEIEYRIAGMVSDEGAARALVAASPPNVRFLGYQTPAGLVAEMQAAKVYAQLSYHEGFGVAVAEAMACGCVPVTTDRGSLPEVAGARQGIGYCVPVEDPAAAAAAFRAAVADPDPARGARAREHIRASFAPAARAASVIGAIEEMVR